MSKRMCIQRFPKVGKIAISSVNIAVMSGAPHEQVKSAIESARKWDGQFDSPDESWYKDTLYKKVENFTDSSTRTPLVFWLIVPSVLKEVLQWLRFEKDLYEPLLAAYKRGVEALKAADANAECYIADFSDDLSSRDYESIWNFLAAPSEKEEKIYQQYNKPLDGIDAGHYIR